MKAKNRRIYSKDKEVLVTLREEYIMLGFDTSLDEGCLTVYTLPRKKKSKVDRHRKV